MILQATVVNKMRPVEAMIALQPQMLDAWKQWHCADSIIVRGRLLAIIGRLFSPFEFDVRLSSSNSTEKATKSEIMILE